VTEDLLTTATTLIGRQAQPDLLRSALAMWLVLALIGFIVVVVMAILISGRHRRRLRAAARKRVSRSVVQDAWAEAGRRAEPMEMDEPFGPKPDEERS
jgi:hypothetical protein